MTPYAHNTAMLAGEDNLCIAQLAPHTTFNTQWVWPRVGSRPSRVETFLRSHPETTFQVYKHFDHTGNRTPVAWTQIQSANLYTTDPRSSSVETQVVSRQQFIDCHNLQKPYIQTIYGEHSLTILLILSGIYQAFPMINSLTYFCTAIISIIR